LPRLADPGEEIPSRLRALVDGLVVVRAVEPDRRAADQHARPRRRRADRLDDPPRRIEAARPDGVLPRRRPSPGGDRLAGQVHDRVRALDARGQIVPGDGARGPCLARPRGAARHYRDLVACAAERLAERAADEARAAGYDDAQRSLQSWRTTSAHSS